MTNSTKYIFDPAKQAPWYSMILLVVIFLAGLFIGQFFGTLFSFLVTDLSFGEIGNLASPPYTAGQRIPLLLIQGFGALGGFIIGGIVYLRFYEPKQWHHLFQRSNINLYSILIASVLVISFMFVNTIFIEWNANLDFPDFMKGFEEWASQKEDDLKMVTEFLTEYRSIWEFLLGFVVIAIIPAVGEELIFRGILQNKFHQYFRNIHVAIILSAIIFSGFHIQFYGFIPRLMLGIVFGYMYYWSQNLWYPIIGHFINNGMTLILIYMYQAGHVGFDIENQEKYPYTVIIIFAVITVYMMISFKRKVKPEGSKE